MRFFPALIITLLLVTGCGAQAVHSGSAPAPATASSATTTTAASSTTPAPTVQPVPSRKPTYPYTGEHGAVLEVTCNMTEGAKSLTYTASGKNLGVGTLRIAQSGKPGYTFDIGDDGSADTTPSALNTGPDTIVEVEVHAANYNATRKFRGCEPYAF